MQAALFLESASCLRGTEIAAVLAQVIIQRRHLAQPRKMAARECEKTSPRSGPPNRINIEFSRRAHCS